MAYCNNCGAYLPDGATTCTTCGAPVASAQTPADNLTPPADQPQEANAGYNPNAGYPNYQQPMNRGMGGGYRANIRKRELAITIILSIVSRDKAKLAKVTMINKFIQIPY